MSAIEAISATVSRGVAATKVLYTGAFRFPDQDAAALRVHSVAGLFEQVGCRVSFAGWERAKPGNDHYVFEGHDCYPQSEFRERARSIGGRLLGFLARGRKTVRWLASHHHFDIIVVYNPPALFSLLLLVLCWRWRVRLVLDSTEWYEAEHLPGGRFGPAALENWLRMRLVYPLFRHVICISRFLERHYAGRNVVTVAPLQEASGGDATARANSVRSPIASGVTFVYAGDAGKKDRLVAFIRALPVIGETLQRPVELRIAGMDEAVLDRLLGMEGICLSSYAPFIKCYGRVSRAHVGELYDHSHFSVLFREDKRYARAGFPTKAVESWSHGCPIIANRVGDLGVIAEDLSDAILISEEYLASRLPVVLKAIIDGGLHPGMSARCREKAALLFSRDAHFRAFQRFFQQLDLSS